MYKALIIDDEKPVIKAITALGEWTIHNIEQPYTASNGQEGMQSMYEIKPDIVFVDMQMPVMNGVTFLQKTAHEFPSTQFIVVSGYDEFEYAQESIKHGVIDYILKPITKETVENAITKACSILSGATNKETTQSYNDENISADQVVEMIKYYLEKNYCNDISISMFSDKYYFSKEYLSKLFKKKYGYGIYEFALNIRMERAKELLQNKDIFIKDISDRLGYSNSNYFSKAFKNYYNISPTDFREQP